MALQPQTQRRRGFRTDPNTVESRVTRLLDKDNPYMQRAATRGAQSANRRGLLNSSIATTAVEAARIDAALPIASQDSAQGAQYRMQRRDIRSREGMQGRDIESRERMQGRDIESREAMQGRDIASRETMQGRDIESAQYMQGRDLESRERIQQADLAAARERLSMELGSRESLQSAEIAAQKERLGMQLSQQERLALAELQAAEERLGVEISSRETMAQWEIESRERVAAMDIDARQQQNAAAVAAQFEQSYATLVANIMNNPDIPAAERQRYLNQAADMRNSNYALVEQFYGIDLVWATPGRRQINDPPTRPRDVGNRGQTP